MNKEALSAEIIRILEDELAVLEESARAAHEAATHEESKAEDAHDTRGLEASYLAGAQRARIEVLKNTMIAFKAHPLRNFKPEELIAVGACAELSVRGKKNLYLLVESGGGLAPVVDGRTVQVVSVKTPLGEALLGRVRGEIFELEDVENSPEYQVLAVF